MSNLFSVIGLHNSHRNLKITPDVRIWGKGSLKRKLLQSLFRLLKITYTLQQLSIALMDFCNLVLVCNDIVPK